VIQSSAEKSVSPVTNPSDANGLTPHARSLQAVEPAFVPTEESSGIPEAGFETCEFVVYRDDDDNIHTHPFFHVDYDLAGNDELYP
jgi:hypothetical protein